MKLVNMSLFLALSSLGFGQEILTAEDAVKIAIDHSPQVHIAKSQYDQARARSRQAKGLLGYRIDGTATYQRYLQTVIFGPGVPGQTDSKSAGLSISYPVDFAGLSRKAWAAADANERAAWDAVIAQENLVRGRVRAAYFNALRAEEAIRIQEDALKATQARLDIAQKRFNAGDLAKFDVLRLEADVKRAETAVLEAKNNTTLAKQVLNNALSRDVDTPVALEVTELPASPSTDVEGLLSLANKTRSEIQQLEHLLAARKFVTYTERGGLTPSLKLSANYQHVFDANAFQREDQVTLVAGLTFPLWDSGITRAKIRAAQEDEKQVQFNIDSLKLGIGLEVRSAVVRLKNAQDQIELAQKTVDLQREALRLAQLRFDVGEGILLDAIVAQADLTRAEVGLISARHEFRLAYAALQQAVGTDQLPPQQ